MEIADTEMGACKECQCDTQSPEGISKTTCNEIVRGVNEGVQSLSVVNGDDGSKEKATKISVDEDTQEELSHEAVNDRGPFEANGSHQDDDVNLIFLREKLSAALLNLSIKDESVKQHSKVAEEAVLGWEKAEKETAALKQQLDAAVESKSALEARVSHLDEALKECVRQLRLGRDEQEMSITQAVAERTGNLEAAKTELEDQLIELQERVENCRVSSPDLELQYKVEHLERENIYLKQHLQTLCEELEVRSIERDLSTKAAETASKQHLESINKVARLEAECRKLKSRMSSSNDHAASSYVDSLTHSHSSSWTSSVLITELDQFKSEKVTDKSLHSSKEINLMDDFLEMERLAGLPDTRPRVRDGCNQKLEKPFPGNENKLKAEFNSLEESLGRVEADKAELELALAQTQRCLDKSEVQLREAQIKMEQLERDLHGVIEGEQLYKEVAASLEEEAKLMSSQLMSLRGELTRERALSEEKASRIEQLEGELKEKKEEVKLKDVALAETRVLLEMSEAQLRETEAKVKELEKDLNKAIEEKESLNSELDNVRAQVDSTSTQIDSLTQQVSEKQCLEVQFSTKVKELERMSIENESLNRKVHKEEALVAELFSQVKELERELQQKRVELQAQQRVHSDPERKIKQEELAAAAAGKLADCQKTIASLGSQLNSLAALEDFLIDTASIPPTPLIEDRRNSGDPWKLHSNDTFLVEKRLEAFASHSRGEPQTSPVSSTFFLNPSDPDKIENGFAKYFSISRN